MVPMKARVNTLFLDNQKLYIDPLSKCYVVAECVLGLNRVPMMTKGRKYFYLLMLLLCSYSLLIDSLFLGYFYFNYYNYMTAVWHALWFEYTLCDVVGFFTWKRMYRYYNELNKFDRQIGCRPKMTSESLRHSIVMAMLLASNIIFLLMLTLFYWNLPSALLLPLILMDIAHCLEISYCGHLLSLLIPRMCLINYNMALSVSSESSVRRPDIEEFVSFKSKNKRNAEMNKLMDLYQILIKAYDLLMDAIKWQLLVILITSFLVTLRLLYGFANSLMQPEGITMVTVTSGVEIVSQMLPIFSPCIFGDRVHNQVRKLRELIASRLYENKLDKAGRSSARALLALTEARDLSFTLLRMLRVDVALPFKFSGLLVTYLIILLQFDKVIHPATSTNGTITT